MTDARAQYEPILVELLDLYPAFLGSSPHNIRQGWNQVAHIAHGWYMRCHRNVAGVLILDREGLAQEGAPLRRSVIEHCVALNWLAKEGDDILDTLARGHSRPGEQLWHAIADACWTSIDLAEVDAAIASTGAASRNRPNDYLLHFTQRLEQYGDAQTLPGYLAETQQSHPTYESAMSYVEVPSGHLISDARNPIWQVPFATTHLLEASLSVRVVFDPPPWGDLIPHLVHRFQQVTDQVRAQDGLPPVTWNSWDDRHGDT